MFADTHCHLNFKAFQKTGALHYHNVVSQAQQSGVDIFIVPGTDIATSQKALTIAQEFDQVYAAVGVHPHHVAKAQSPKHQTQHEDTLENWLKKLEELVKDKKVVAVGEVGIDLHVYSNTKYKPYEITSEFISLQKELFQKQTELANTHKKALIIHNWEAKQQVLSILNTMWDKNMENRMVFHCCEADQELLDYAKERHIFIGVDGDVTYNAQKQEFVKLIPLDRLVLETDSPYLLPEPFRSQKRYPNTPSSIPLIGQCIARLKNESVAKVEEVTYENSKRLFLL